MADKVGGKCKVQSNGKSKARKITTRSTSKSITNTQVFHCRICQDVIKELNEDGGEDSVQCNGLCDGWIHRRCAGLSLARFEEISTSNDPFYCPSCCAARNRVEIHSLKSALASLTSEVNDLKTALSQIASQTVDLPDPGKENCKTPKQPKGTQPLPIVSSESSPKIVTSSNVDNESDKKFNLVVYGIKESANGTP